MKYIFLTLCVIMCVSCSISGDKKGTTDGLEHRIKYSRKGTRSEASHGYLYYRGRVLPDAFRTVSWKGITYRFFVRQNLWGRDGYFPLSGFSAKVVVDKDLMPERALKAGYFKGSVRYKDTPVHWVFVTWDYGSAFLDPGVIHEFVREQGIKPLPRVEGNFLDVKKPALILKRSLRAKRGDL